LSWFANKNIKVVLSNYYLIILQLSWTTKGYIRYQIKQNASKSVTTLQIKPIIIFPGLHKNILLYKINYFMYYEL